MAAPAAEHGPARTLTRRWCAVVVGEAVRQARNPRTHAQWVRQVNECTLAIDEGVGKLLETLKASGQLENTLLIFTADQGFSSGEHGFRTKLAPYDANYNSPLIISRPGTLPEGKVVSACPQNC